MARRLAYDLLAIDLDGTLLDSQHNLPPQNRAGLHQAHQAGMKIVLCTGRSFTETRPILAEIGLDLDATVTVSGAIVTDVPTSWTLDRTALPLRLTHDLTQWFQQLGYAVLWLLDRDQAGFDGYVIDGPRRHFAIDRWREQSPCQIECVDHVPPRTVLPVRITIVDETTALQRVARELHRAFNGRLAYNILRVPAYDFTVIETFAPQVSKWYGIRKLCRRWNIDPRRTVAVGDDVNDVAMIRAAGLGVAVANANPAAKKVARRVIASNDDCGVASLIEQLLVPGGSDKTSGGAGVPPA